MADSCFVDTNVLLYWRGTGESTKQELAGAWLQVLWRERAGRLSWQVIVEFAANARRIAPGAPYERARRDIVRFLQWDPVPTNRLLIETAWRIEDRYGSSWWDALIVAAAQVAGCTYLLSEDMQDGQHYGAVTVVNPFLHDVTAVLGI